MNESMTLKWNFRRGGGVQAKKPSMGGIWIFSGTTQYAPAKTGNYLSGIPIFRDTACFAKYLSDNKHNGLHLTP